MEDVVVRIAPANEFQTFLLSQPELLFRFSQRLLHGLNGMLLRVESLSLQNAKKRVISILLYLARHFGEQQGQQLILRPYFTHQELATFIGLARETTSIEISKLEKQGLIAYQESSFVILDPARLEAELHR
jgi:CRP/FNR family transcriptional regulator